MAAPNPPRPRPTLQIGLQCVASFAPGVFLVSENLVLYGCYPLTCFGIGDIRKVHAGIFDTFVLLALSPLVASSLLQAEVMLRF